jgi:hypothetical protein
MNDVPDNNMRIHSHIAFNHLHKHIKELFEFFITRFHESALEILDIQFISASNFDIQFISASNFSLIKLVIMQILVSFYF